MNILILGTGQGSFTVRGHQLGAAIGARVASAVRPNDLTWADVVVLVKRAGIMWAEYVRRADRPIVWDALDFWHQPDDNSLFPSAALEHFRRQVALIDPVLTITATEAMAAACGATGRYLPHHARPGLERCAVRENVQTVAYEGTRKYLGRWAKVIQAECDKRGWTFVINPPSLSQADLVVAFRDGIWDGWMCRNWKSGVKLVNAMAVGRPILTQTGAAWEEIRPSGATLDAFEDLPEVFDFWADPEVRALAMASGADYSLDRVAKSYKALIEAAA